MLPKSLSLKPVRAVFVIYHVKPKNLRPSPPLSTATTKQPQDASRTVASYAGGACLAFLPGNRLSPVARKSAIHGRGVYATRAIPAGAALIEYTSERITQAEARRRERLRLKAARLDPTDDTAYNYLFIANDKTGIDGRHEISPARLINHA